LKLEFTKMSGAGNDFIFLGPEYGHLRDSLPALAQKLCPRRTAVGADGLILVERAPEGLIMHYFNSDGSEASFCGNGARCLVLYCIEKGIAAGRVEFVSRSGKHWGERTARGIRVAVDMPALVRELEVRVGGNAYHTYLVDAGVPHAVVLSGSVGGIDVEALGSSMRHDPAFQPDGANVDFVGTEGHESFDLRTYERGVEHETLACGSGCAAAALVLRHVGLAGSNIALRVASGDLISVEMAGDGTSEHLVGPAVIVYEGQLELKELDHV
jgi:diaminopimelate epimerase